MKKQAIYQVAPIACVALLLFGLSRVEYDSNLFEALMAAAVPGGIVTVLILLTEKLAGEKNQSIFLATAKIIAGALAAGYFLLRFGFHEWYEEPKFGLYQLTVGLGVVLAGITAAGVGNFLPAKAHKWGTYTLWIVVVAQVVPGVTGWGYWPIEVHVAFAIAAITLAFASLTKTMAGADGASTAASYGNLLVIAIAGALLMAVLS